MNSTNYGKLQRTGNNKHVENVVNKHDNVSTVPESGSTDYNLYDLDDVSSEDDNLEPISGIVKRIVENNKTPDKLLNSLSHIKL